MSIKINMSLKKILNTPFFIEIHLFLMNTDTNIIYIVYVCTIL